MTTKQCKHCLQVFTTNVDVDICEACEEKQERLEHFQCRIVAHVGLLKGVGVKLNEIKAGDRLGLSFGIPPKVAKFIVEGRNGALVAVCENAKPKEMTLSVLVDCYDVFKLEKEQHNDK